MDTSNLGHITQVQELRDDELDAVSGGLVVNAIIAVLIGLLLPEPPPTAGKHGIGPVWRRKIMSGTEDTSKVEHAMLEEHNIPADTELNAASGGYARGTPSVSEIVVTKQQDCASTGLFK
jgi:hypothetical protein